MKINPIIVIALALWACGSSQNTQNQTHPKDTPAAPALKLPIAYVNIDSLNLYYKFYEEKAKELEEERRRVKLELENRAYNWEKKRQSFEAQANAKLLSAKQIEEKQAELLREQQEIQTYEITRGQGLQAKAAEVDKELYKRVNDFLAEYNKDGRYAFIMSHIEAGGPFLYVSPQYDITKEVIDSLNARYDAEKKARK